MQLSSQPFKRALYLQVRDLLAQRIASGGWTPGAPIPNENDLAREVGVSSGTVRKALDLMATQRLITRRQGRGSFVNDLTANELAARFNNIRGAGGERIAGQIKSLDITPGAATSKERARLCLPEGAAVFRIHRAVAHAGRIFLVEDVTLPAESFPDLLDKQAMAEDIVSLAQHYGILLGRGEERISTIAPPEAIARSLGVTSDLPVMMLDRVLFMLDNGSSPVEWRIAYYHLADTYYLSEMP
jgi:GntR family transcriptional regulator